MVALKTTEKSISLSEQDVGTNSFRNLLRSSPPPPSKDMLVDHTVGAKEWKALHNEFKHQQETIPAFGLAVTSLKETYTKSPSDADKLIDRIYDAYIEAFPDESQRTAKQEMRDVVSDFTDARDVLVFKDGENIIGAIHFTAFGISYGKHAVAEYVYTDQKVARPGSGKKMVTLWEDSLRNCGFLLGAGEVNDPQLMTPAEIKLDTEGSMDPSRRVKYWDRSGYSAIEFPYGQPPLGGQSKPCNYMTLVVKFFQDRPFKSMLTDHVLEFAEGYFKTFTTREGYQSTLDQMQEVVGNEFAVPVTKLSSPRRYPRLKD